MDLLRDSMLAWWSTLLYPFLASVLPTLLKAAVVLAIAVYLARRATGAFRRAARRGVLDASMTLLVARITHLGILGLGVAVALDIAGVPLSAIITAVGLVGLAVSLALQDLLRNFFSGVYLLFERPFQLGDRIKVRDHEGVVEHVGFRTMLLRTDANVEILIPNSLVIAEVVSNHTRAVRPSTGSQTVEEESRR